MSDTSQIRVKLEPTEPDEPAQLADFTKVCTALQSCLNHVGRCVGQETPFGITGLEIGSAILKVSPIRDGDAVVNAFNRATECLQAGERLDPRLDFSALKAFSDFFSTINNPRVRLTIGDLLLTTVFVANLKSLLEPQCPALGSVSGRLESISVHGKNQFTLYPPFPSEKVDCTFEESALPDVLAAVGSQVTVFGTLHYASAKVFPVSVVVNDFKVEPESSTLPSLLESRATQQPGHASVEAQRAVRDEWR